MRLGDLLADLAQGTANLRQFQIVEVPHRRKSMRLKQIHEREPDRVSASGSNDGRKLARAQPIAKRGVRNLEVDGGLRNAVSGFFVEFQVPGVHVGTVLTRRSPSILA